MQAIYISVPPAVKTTSCKCSSAEYSIDQDTCIALFSNVIYYRMQIPCSPCSITINVEKTSSLDVLYAHSK